MDKDKLFNPSLAEDDEVIETYDINKFIYVAFFGGVIPLVGLATQTARKFKIDGKTIKILAAVGGLILLGKFIIVYTIMNNQGIVDRRTLSWIYKGASCLLYLAYSRVLKERFTIHVGYGGEIKPIFWDAAAWIFGGTLAEAGLAMLVAWLAGAL